MPTYVITGVSKGLGWEFLNQLSSNPDNTIIGIVRRKAATDERVAQELQGRSNIHILEADMTDYNALKKAAAETAKITGGAIDYLIANAGIVTQFELLEPIGNTADQPQELTKSFHEVMNVNVLANIHLYNLFMPQVLAGKTKKVFALSSGMGDMDLANNYDLYNSSLYSASKAALNMITAKFSAQYKKDGVLFLSICPGMVEVGHYDNVTPAQSERMGGLMEKFQRYSPSFTGPDTPAESIKSVLSVVERSSIENGDGGAYLSHFGNKQWV